MEKNKKIIDLLNGISIDDDFDFIEEDATYKNIDLLLGGDADINFLDNNHRTALDYAVEHEDIKTAEYLLINGAIPCLAFYECTTEEQLLKNIMFLQVVEYNFNSLDKLGFAAIHYAVAKGYTQALQFLIEESKANVNLKDINGNSPLSLALDEKHLLIRGSC
jgi:ankyrin repeat protein